MLRVEVFKVSIDKSLGVSAQGDKRADVVEDGGRVGFFLGGVDLLVVGIDGEPWVGAGGEAGLGGAIPLHGSAGVVARNLRLGAKESLSGDFASVDEFFVGVLYGDIVVVVECLKREVRHAKLIAFEEEGCAAKGKNQGLEELGGRNAHFRRVVPKRGDDPRIVVIGEEDRVPFVLG